MHGGKWLRMAQGGKKLVHHPGSYDVEFVVKGCTRDPRLGLELAKLVAHWIRKRGYRFLIRLVEARFEDCIDVVRPLTQEFINASFIIVEGDYETDGMPRLARIHIHVKEDGTLTISEEGA